MPSNKKKEIWVKGAEVIQTSIFFMSEPTKFLVQEWPKFGLGNKIQHYISYMVEDFCRMYFIRHEFDSGAEFLTRKMFRDPVWALRLIDKIERWSKLFMNESKNILSSRMRTMTDKQLIKLYTDCLHYHALQNGVGASVSWLADAEKERFTKGLWRRLEEHMQTVGSMHNIAEVFSILTTPREESFVAKEERDFLAIAITIYHRSRVRNIFRSNKISNILPQIHTVDKKLFQRIRNHHAKYCWLSYQYRGPASPIEEYLERWKEMIKGKSNPQALLTKYIRDRKQILARQSWLVKHLEITPSLKKLILLGQRMVFIKAFRKEAVYHGMYAYDPLLREMGRRLGLTIAQMWAMKTEEVTDALLNHAFNVDELNDRQKLAVVFIDRKHHTIYSGKKAKVFLKKLSFEKAYAGKVREFQGTPACPGKVRGIVKIVNIPEEMKKMKKGDVMVAHNTNPNLVPAMKKAAALVSESGGLTCHTAIVARELRIPCIVGVIGADKLLKDGDKVEVNATTGIICKIK
ncbi:PEP-utilizing enzyme [Patescibacteria group bacterium]